MKAFLRKHFGQLLGVPAPRPRRGDTRVSYWMNMDRKWNFHVQDGNNEVVCQSSQGYGSEAACLAGIENARHAFTDAVVVQRELA